jgi:hypothetical protein
MHRRVSTLCVVLGGAFALLLAVPAQAGQARTEAARTSTAVAAQPVTGTPSFPVKTKLVEQVRQLVQCGTLMYAVGTFSVVDSAGKAYQRNNAFSFTAAPPFTMTSWNPNVNGIVNSITFNSGNCSDAYLGGSFTSVGKQPAGNIAEVTTAGTGALVPAFGHSASARVETLASYQHHILAGGFFTTINGSSKDPYMASLNATTGKNDRFVGLSISGHYTFPGASYNHTKVYNQQISHSGQLDLVEGDFTSVGGKRRHQIFMLDLASRPKATLTAWTSPRFDGSKGYPPNGFYYNCGHVEPFYIRAAAWSPDDQTIYLATTGYRPWNHRSLPARGLCDAAAAFSANPAAPALEWINYTGCDSLYSVAADDAAVYFGGHERYSENPDDCDAPGPGSVPDPGMEGLDPATGALLTNSSGDALYTRGRGLGADDMVRNDEGLWIASDNFDDTAMCGGVQGLSGICFLPADLGDH